MATLDELPTELILMIAASLGPPDALNFAVMSKTYWQACRPVIEEHQHLAKRYRHWDINGLWSRFDIEVGWKRSVWALFETICRDPRIAHHIRILNHTTAGRGELPPPETRMKQCQETAERSRALQNIDMTLVIEALSSVNPGKMLCVLLHMCPSINELWLHVDTCDALLPHLWKILCGPESDGDGILSKLESVEVSSFGGLRPCSLEWCDVLIRLPSMRTFIGYDFCTGYDCGRLRSPCSNLTSLEFVYSQITPSQLHSLLSQIRFLERFAYLDAGESPGYVPHLCGMIQALASCQRHSLLSLSLTLGRGPFYRNMSRYEGFKAFNNLKFLHVEEAVFKELRFGCDGPVDQRSVSGGLQIGEDLPPSLEHLNIEGRTDYKLLEKFVNAVSVYTPLLQRLTVNEHAPGLPSSARCEWRPRLMEACARAGVEFVEKSC